MPLSEEWAAEEWAAEEWAAEEWAEIPAGRKLQLQER
jgi:hypothetical protein